MKPAIKQLLSGIATSIIALLFLMWGISDFVYLFDWPPILIFIIPAIVAGIIMLTCMSFYFVAKKKDFLLNPKRLVNCSKCGTPIKLATKYCVKCGSENVHRLDALDKLTELEQKAQERQAEILEKSQSKKWRTPRSRKQEEMELKLLNSQVKKVKIRILQLTIGSEKEDKIRWAKEEYEKGTRILDIAESLGENLDSVRQYIDSDI